MKSLLAVLALSIAMFAQGAPSNANFPTGDPVTTVSGLSSVSTKIKGGVAGVTDGNSSSDCTVGGGSTAVLCQYSGSIWAAIAGGGGSPAFSAVTAGTNTAVLSEGGVGSITPTIPGQVTANSLWLNTGGISGLPIPMTASIGSVTLTGGGLTFSTAYWFKETFSNGTQTSQGSSEISLQPQTFPSSTCTSGNVCTMTITAPSFPPGVTSWTLYSSTSSGTELATAGCTNIGAGVNCVFSAVGAGAAPPATQVPQVLPPGTLVNDCNAQGVPWLWSLKGDGKYHGQAMIDETQSTTQAPNGPNIGGTIHFCGRMMFDDTGYAAGNLYPNSTPGRASAFNFLHASGINQGQGCCPPTSAQDDRTVSFFNWSPVGDASVRTGMQIAAYSESGINGHPTLAAGAGTTTTLAGLRTNCFVNSDVPSTVFPGSAFCHEAVLEFDAGTFTSFNAAVAGHVSVLASEAITQNNAYSYFADLTCGACPSKLGVYAGYYSKQNVAQRAQANYGFYSEDWGTNAADFDIVADSGAAGSGRSFFGGPVVINQSLSGSALPGQLTAITSNAIVTPTCITTCTATYTYKLVAKDSLGGWAPVGITLTTVVGATTLNGSNFNTLTVTTGGRAPAVGASFGTYSYDIYRTASTGTPSTVGYIGNMTCFTPSGCSFVDNAVAISTPTTSEPVTPPANNTSGASGGYTFRSVTNCKVNSASPAACVAAPVGSIVVPTTTATYTVNTTVVTTNSQIFLQLRTDNSGLPSAPTCVALALTSVPAISARVPGTSFTFTLPSTTGSTCFDYYIIN